jgi:hypothetical protein
MPSNSQHEEDLLSAAFLQFVIKLLFHMDFIPERTECID